MTAATYTYDPCGNTTTSTGSLATTNPWHYAGSYTDTATGYLKLDARYYNPTTVRFTQPDLSGKETNTYNYTSCNPINSTDPSGLDTVCDYESIGAGAVTAIMFSELTPVPDAILSSAIGLGVSNQCENPGPYTPEYNQDGAWVSP
jgi:RHS repeat-associated protein